nr:histidine kinase [Janibacter terrae]
MSAPLDQTVTSRWLRLGRHALLGVLALVCGLRAIVDGAHPLAEIAALAAFIGWYSVGPRLARAGTRWFLVLVLLWTLLVLVSPENVWLAFPLWLLAGHVLPLLPAVLISLGVFVVVALEPVRQTGAASFAAIIGPLIGMVVALGVAWAQQALVRDGIERQRLIASLYAAQEETAALTDELARVQRAEGATSERTRLSRDIHDGIAQGFSSIVLLARAAGAEEDPARVRELLGHLEDGATRGLEESRRVVAALAPADLDEGSSPRPCAGSPSASRRSRGSRQRSSSPGRSRRCRRPPRSRSCGASRGHSPTSAPTPPPAGSSSPSTRARRPSGSTSSTTGAASTRTRGGRPDRAPPAKGATACGRHEPACARSAAAWPSSPPPTRGRPSRPGSPRPAP